MSEKADAMWVPEAGEYIEQQAEYISRLQAENERLRDLISDRQSDVDIENIRLRAALKSIAAKGEFPDEYSVYSLASEAERALTSGKSHD